VAELRKGWTQALLYPGMNKPPRQRTSLTLAMAVLACRLGALALRAIRAMSGVWVSLWDSSQRLLGAACNEALTLDEKSRLTVRIYDFFPGYHRTYDRLHPWEGPWFERRLPAAGARVLVGGAGVGREAVALATQGLVVDAFDPAPDLVAACRRALDARSQVGVLSYETFSSLVLDDAMREEGQAWLADRYDAILLGSGSLTHVLDPSEHQRLLRACAAVCPSGPILMSFYCADDSSDRPPAGRAMRCGAALGRATAMLRGMSAAGSPRLSYRPHGGFAYTFTPAEIECLAASIGRDLSWEPGTTGDFRCVTFLPSAIKPAPAP
jgi:SAM-dependent methyltransferase